MEKDLPADEDGEKHTIYYCDPVKAIESLWQDPTLAEDFCYKPQKIYSDSTKSQRIYNEMWTGDWWHNVQVSLNQRFLSLISDITI